MRYAAIRVRKRQGELFADGSEARYFAVATNQWEWSAKKLLEWHREKAGSIEALHDVLKNELAAGVMPCGRFGANAAWLRMAVLTHNVLTGLKRIALKPDWLRARPKELRFHFFFSPGKLIHHARRLLARVGPRALELQEWAEAWRLLPVAGYAERITGGLSKPSYKCPKPEVRAKIDPGPLANESGNRSAAETTPRHLTHAVWNDVCASPRQINLSGPLRTDHGHIGSVELRRSE